MKFLILIILLNLVFLSHCQIPGQGNQPSQGPQQPQQQFPQQPQPQQQQQQPQQQQQQQQPQQPFQPQQQQQQPQQQQMQTPFNTQGLGQAQGAPSAGLPFQNFLPFGNPLQGGFPLPNGMQGAPPPTGSNDPFSFAANIANGVMQGLASIPNYFATMMRPPNFG